MIGTGVHNIWRKNLPHATQYLSDIAPLTNLGFDDRTSASEHLSLGTGLK
jgi:hypothetical protein